MTFSYPSTWAGWRDVAILHVAALVGWFTHPLLWPVSYFNPFLFLLAIGATASQESTYNRDAAGDGGDSVGMLQYNIATWPDLTGRDLGDRTSPWWSGYYAAAYVQDALLASWAWWPALMVPVFRIAAFRRMWTNGVSARTAESVWSEAWTDASSIGERTWPGARFWALVLALPVVVTSGVLVQVIRRAWRGGRK